MKFAVYLPNFGCFGDARTLAQLAWEAELAGWDGFFIWDHIARTWSVPVVDPQVALAAIAMNTERIRFGALVTPLARRRPWKFARETASLDRLSRGRLTVGVGIGSRGGREVEWGAFGEEPALSRRAAMLDEGLAIVQGLWTGEPFSHDGAHYRVEESRFTPPPGQSPRIPVWVAGYWPNRAPFRRAARWDGAFPLFRGADDLAGLRALVDFIAEERQADAPFDVVHLGPATPGDDPARGAEIVAPYAEAGATWWLERLTPDRFGAEWDGDWPFEAMRERVMQGPPRQT